MAGRSAVARNDNVEEDNWHSVADARERKKIQDRLAQRARRKRLREARNNSALTPYTYGNTTLSSDNAYFPITNKTYSISQADSSITSLSALPETSFVAATSACNTSARIQSICPSYDLNYPLTVMGALYINGRILGLMTCITYPSKSSPASSEVPPPLQPTPIQLNTLHSTGIDRFPFPRMRDNLISLTSVINEEELTADLFTMPSFEIKIGGAPWDPAAWKIEKPFAEKWGFLFCEA